MSDNHDDTASLDEGRGVPVSEAVGMILAHEITEIRPGEFKGPPFKKGHVVWQQDSDHLQRLGNERLSLLSLAADEMHEDDAAQALAKALMGEGVRFRANRRKERSIPWRTATACSRSTATR